MLHSAIKDTKIQRESQERKGKITLIESPGKAIPESGLRRQGFPELENYCTTMKGSDTVDKYRLQSACKKINQKINFLPLNHNRSGCR